MTVPNYKSLNVHKIDISYFKPTLYLQ